MINAAVISPDEELRSTFHDRSVAREIDVTLELRLAPEDVSAGHLEDLRDRRPDLVFLDLEGDPDLACRLVGHVADALPGSRIIGSGPMQGPEFLLQAMQAGVSEYLTKPVMPEDILATLGRSRRALAPREVPTRSVGRLFAFFSPKRGAGSTTLATNLAIQLYRLTGKRTIVVDLDLELGECALFLGLEPRFNVVDLAGNLHRIDRELLASYVQPHDSGIHLLAAPYQPEKANEVTVDQIVRILKLLKEHYDFVIVDSPKALTPRTVRAFEQADQVFLVAQTNVPTIQNIQRSEALLERLRRNGRGVKLIVNRYDPHVDVTLNDLERSTEMDVYWTVGNDYQTALYSMNSGKPFIMTAGSVCARELEGLAVKITGASAQDGGSRGGLFGSIFGRLKDRLSATAPGEFATGEFRLPPLPAEGEWR